MSNYELVLSEYDKAQSDDEHSKLIFGAFGVAVFNAQIVEESLCQMIWLQRVNSANPAQNSFAEVIEEVENSKKTLGKLLRDIKSCYEISQEHIDLLEKILKERNFLIHKYFRINSLKFYSNIGRKEMLKYFSDFIDLAQGIEKILKSYYKHYLDNLGITEEVAEKLFDHEKTTELQRD